MVPQLRGAFAKNPKMYKEDYKQLMHACKTIIGPVTYPNPVTSTPEARNFRVLAQSVIRLQEGSCGLIADNPGYLTNAQSTC